MPSYLEQLYDYLEKHLGYEFCLTKRDSGTTIVIYHFTGKVYFIIDKYTVWHSLASKDNYIYIRTHRDANYSEEEITFHSRSYEFEELCGKVTSHISEAMKN